MLLFFSFNDTSTTEIYTLSLHDALPILVKTRKSPTIPRFHKSVIILIIMSVIRLSHQLNSLSLYLTAFTADRKSTRLNSSHVEISYAVFCLKKKKKNIKIKENYNK